jgi:hypothetical protein
VSGPPDAWIARLRGERSRFWIGEFCDIRTLPWRFIRQTFGQLVCTGNRLGLLPDGA